MISEQSRVRGRKEYEHIQVRVTKTWLNEYICVYFDAKFV